MQEYDQIYDVGIEIQKEAKGGVVRSQNVENHWFRRRCFHKIPLL